MTPAPSDIATATATATAWSTKITVTPTFTSTLTPTPEFTVPDDFRIQTDEKLGYTLAFPRGWTNLDLRSEPFHRILGVFGLDDMIGQLNDLLDSEQGQGVGIVGISDLTAIMFGQPPAWLSVSVLDASDATQEDAMELIESNLITDTIILAYDEIRLEPATVNNLPAIRGSTLASLPDLDTELSTKVVGLLANDKIYLLILVTPSSKLAAREPVFDQIIDSFTPS